jgi:hypothetical protein
VRLAGSVLAGSVLAGSVLAGSVLAGSVLAGSVLAGTVLLADAGDDGDVLSRSRCALRPPPYTLCVWKVTLDPFRCYGGESEKVLLPHLETKIGFIGKSEFFHAYYTTGNGHGLRNVQ